MASMDSAPTKVSKVLGDQQSLLNSELMNEVLEIKCSNASRPSSGVQAGLRHRLPNSPMEYVAVNDDGQGKYSLLGDPVTTTSKSDMKPHDGFAKCLEKYLNACRWNMNAVLRRKPRRPVKSTKFVTPPQITQTNLEGEDNSTVPCFGRGCWRGLKRKFGSMIKIEEENVTSVPRSVRYYA